MGRLNVLVVEDGEEYSRTLGRFLADEVVLVRAGDGYAALELIKIQSFDLVFLDMRFDRVAPDRLLGDLGATAERFNGDPVRARQFLEEHQGTYVLAALRAEGCTLPAIFSYDFDSEPRRWSNVARNYGPVYYLPDNAAPRAIRDLFFAAAQRS